MHRILIILFFSTLFQLHILADSPLKTITDTSKTWNWFPSEDLSQKKRFYFFWGYNRATFSKTNLHFRGPIYDFTLYDLVATDRPTRFSFRKYFTPATLTIPQYNYRLGYSFFRKWNISLGIDHMKYVITRQQETLLSGIITSEASEKYAGEYLNEPFVLQPDFLWFEHTDGLNLVSIDFEFEQPILTYKDKWKLTGLLGLGGIWVVTRTDVRVFGDGLNNDFHVAGFTMAGKLRLNLEYKSRLFFAYANKVGYMSLPSVLIKNDAPEIADHNIIFWEKFMLLGYRFDIGKKNKKTKGN